ncbi:MAG: 50S ribosomal protein L25 [bacterium]
MTITLNATARETSENLTNLRKSGFVPAVVYGAGKTAENISVTLKDFTKVLKEAGESTTVTLTLPKGKVTVLIHEVTLDPIRNIPNHVDFLVVDTTKPIEVGVPVEFIGVSPAVKGNLGVLVKVLHEIEVRGLASDLPHTIEVDLSKLDVLDSHITIADITLPKGVTALGKDTDIIAAIASIKEEKEEVATPIDFANIEVEKKGKKEEEDGEDKK